MGIDCITITFFNADGKQLQSKRLCACLDCKEEKYEIPQNAVSVKICHIVEYDVCMHGSRFTTDNGIFIKFLNADGIKLQSKLRLCECLDCEGEKYEIPQNAVSVEIRHMIEYDVCTYDNRLFSDSDDASDDDDDDDTDGLYCGCGGDNISMYL